MQTTEHKTDSIQGLKVPKIYSLILPKFTEKKNFTDFESIYFQGNYLYDYNLKNVRILKWICLTAFVVAAVVHVSHNSQNC